MTMMPTKFLRPLDVLEMDIRELDQEPQAKTRHPVGVVDIASTILYVSVRVLSTVEGEISRKLAIRSDEGGSLRYKR